jgi:Uncharacterized protein conserved in bacteria (DUF2064)
MQNSTDKSARTGRIGRPGASHVVGCPFHIELYSECMVLVNVGNKSAKVAACVRLCVCICEENGWTVFLSIVWPPTHWRSCAVLLLFKKELDAITKILLYAPPTKHAHTTMRDLLQTLNIENDWQLHPVPKVDGVGPHDVHSSHLSNILSHAVDLGRRQYPSNVATSVALLGMDAPELPLAEIVAACRSSRSTGHALMCPAADGGYGLLVVPPRAPADCIFGGVLWSHKLTALSQLKALSDQGVTDTVLGPLMHDIDTAHDLDQLVQRLEASTTVAETSLDGGGCLSQPSSLVQQQSADSDHDRMELPSVYCHYTREVLIDLGLLKPSTR